MSEKFELRTESILIHTQFMGPSWVLFMGPGNPGCTDTDSRMSDKRNKVSLTTFIIKDR